MPRSAYISFAATVAISIVIFSCLSKKTEEKINTKGDTIIIRKTNDFEISGDGSTANWENTNWVAIPQRTTAGENYLTKAKLLYSETGMYFLFFCEDKKLTATMQSDFLDLWNEDVIEIFLQPEGKTPAYFEYELSPLNYELCIIVFNEKGILNSWQPFHYEGDRKTRHAVTIQGGEMKSNGIVKSWMTEVYIPYKLLKPVLTTFPSSGTHWKGNLYRIDYDKGEAQWSWQLNSGNFHEYDKFGNLQFE